MDIVREWNEKRSPGEFQKPPPRAPKSKRKRRKPTTKRFNPQGNQRNMSNQKSHKKQQRKNMNSLRGEEKLAALCLQKGQEHERTRAY